MLTNMRCEWAATSFVVMAVVQSGFAQACLTNTDCDHIHGQGRAGVCTPDPSCVDTPGAPVQVNGGAVSCGQLGAMGFCAHPEHGAAITGMCPVTCMGCPASCGPVDPPFDPDRDPVCVVTSAADDGSNGTFRFCLGVWLNQLLPAVVPGRPTVRFDIPRPTAGDPVTISVTGGALPDISRPRVTIDGASQLRSPGGQHRTGVTLAWRTEGGGCVCRVGSSCSSTFDGYNLDYMWCYIDSTETCSDAAVLSPGRGWSKKACLPVSGLSVLGSGSYHGAGDVVIKGLGVRHFPAHGIFVAAARTRVVGVEALGNGGSGIEVDISAAESLIGHSDYGVGGAVLVSGNDEDGINVRAPRVKIANLRAGTDTAGSMANKNRFDGIYIRSTATDSTIGNPGGGVNGSVLVSGNGRHGLNVEAPRTTVSNLRAGTDAAGSNTLKNGANGIELAETAADSVVGTSGAGVDGVVLVSGNLHGIFVRAPRVKIANLLAGTDAAGSIALGNNYDGIYLHPTATDAVIGSSGGGAGGMVLASGNARDGIYVQASRVSISNCRAGTNANGSAAIPNTRGIWVAAEAAILGDSDGRRHGTILASGNRKDGLRIDAPGATVSNCKAGTNADGSSAIPNGGHGLVLEVGAVEAVVGTARNGLHGTVLVSGNRGDGLAIKAPNVRVANLRAGTDANGSGAIMNQDDGIRVWPGADHAVIGDPRFRSAGMVLISGNANNGMRIESQGVKLSNVKAGTDVSGSAAVPNEKDGIRIDRRAAGACVGDPGAGLGGIVLASGNFENGIRIDAPRVKVTNCRAGTDINGSAAVPNGENGVVLDEAAAGAVVGHLNGGLDGMVLVSGNGQNGLVVRAANVQVANVRAGTVADGSIAVPNHQNGIHVEQGATGTVVGDMDISTRGGVLASGNNLNGVTVEAPETSISNLRAGTNAAGLESVSNGGNGVHLYSTASNTSIFGCLVSGNMQAGILSHAADVSVQSTVLGLDANSNRRIANDGHGLQFTPGPTARVLSALHRSAESVCNNIDVAGNEEGSIPDGRFTTDVINCTIGGNRLSGVSFDSSTFVIEVAKTTTIYATTNLYGLGNGWGLQGCNRTSEGCYCSQAGLQCYGTCVGSTVTMGNDYPTQIPANGTVLRMSSVGLSRFDFNELANDAITARLTTLDFSDNPRLDPIPQATQQANRAFSRAMFPVLSSINIHGTNLSSLKADTFSELATTLESLDISGPSVAPPDDVSIDLTGFTKLAVAIWYENKCPRGFYAVTASPTRDDVIICARCPKGSFQGSVGKSGIDSCVQCSSGNVDHDNDPATECVTAPFAMSSAVIMIEGFLPIYNTSQAYLIPGPAQSVETLFSGIKGSVTYSVKVTRRGSTKNAGGTYFVESTTGKMSVETVEPGHYDLVMSAQDGSGKQLEVKHWQFQALPPDTATAANGPNGKGCSAGIMTDVVEFDNSFICNCNATAYEGDNCDTPVAVSSDDRDSTDSTTSLILGTALGSIVVVLIVVAIALKIRAHELSMRAFNFEAELARLQTAGEMLPGQSGIPREIVRQHVTLTASIAAGAFGKVMKAMLDESTLPTRHPPYIVAVKMAKNSTDEEGKALVREAAVMAQVPLHQNVISLIGVVTKGTPILVLVSMCENGSLLEYLRERQRIGGRLNDQERLRALLDVARGMKHLAEYHIIHRDLAARNVLVDTQRTCKVADFGLSRTTVSANPSGQDTYYRSQSGIFPVRWTAPEAMQELKFTVSSDVWSFGVTAFEVYTDGAKPYVGMGNAEVMRAVGTGHRLNKPDGCPEIIYSVLLRCWSDQPEHRPDFMELLATLGAAADKLGLDVSEWSLSTSAAEFDPNSIDESHRRYIDQLDHARTVLQSLDQIPDVMANSNGECHSYEYYPPNVDMNSCHDLGEVNLADTSSAHGHLSTKSADYNYMYNVLRRQQIAIDARNDYSRLHTDQHFHSRFLTVLQIMSIHQAAYDELLGRWSTSSLGKHAFAELERVDNQVSSGCVLRPGNKALQPNPFTPPIAVTSKRYILKLLSHFEQLLADGFAFDGCAAVAAELGVEWCQGPLKKERRILEKALLRDNRFNEIRDYARGSFIVDNLENMARIVERIGIQPQYQIVRTKNRFAANYDAKESSGYRDYQMVVMIDREYLVEIQIIPREMYRIKSKLSEAVSVTTPPSAGELITGHGAYKQYRAIKESKLRLRRTSDLAVERVFSAHSGTNPHVEDAAATSYSVVEEISIVADSAPKHLDMPAGDTPTAGTKQPAEAYTTYMVV